MFGEPRKFSQGAQKYVYVSERKEATKERKEEREGERERSFRNGQLFTRLNGRGSSRGQGGRHP